MVFTVNNKFQICFDPDDADFSEGVFDAIVKLDKKYKLFQDETRGADYSELYDDFKRVGAEMREEIDRVLKFSVCENLVDDAAALLYLSSGTPIWFNILYSVVEKINVPTKWICQKVIDRYISKRS